MVSVTLLKARAVRLSFQKVLLVLSVRFLRRWMAQVVSLTSRFETTPDLTASKYVVFCSQSLNCPKISKLGLATNKQFKSDSARLAFLVWVWLSVYGGQMKCRGRVLHTLIGR
ncbi:hypothetical protein D5E83_24650 [Vibrio parahaemolyticus]|nr:hypothetical protein D5E83_24650 [Vibrio parahaemolyticus]